MRLSTFYKFEWRFCNARSGWEKGNVERSVNYVRGRAFTSRVDFDDIEEARNWLRQVCIDMNAEIGSSATENKPRMLEEEINALKPYPGEIGCYELSEYKVDKQSTICIRDNDIAYEDVVDAETLIRSNGVKTFTADHFKVALQTMKSKDEPFRDEQKTDEFIEIETGSEDILSQLENVMENGTKLPE